MSTTPHGWTPDVMEGFEAARLSSGTLVRPVTQPPQPRLAVLHVHGYNDYFFQRHLADAVTRAGHAFFAVDLDRAGRSLQPGEIPHFMTDIAEQGDGIDAAVDAIAAAHPGLGIVVHAHSTGGLAAVIWAHDRAHEALAGLVLDSPLFGLPLTRTSRWIGLATLAALRARPRAVVHAGPSRYASRMHVDGGGRWDFDTAWKRPEGVPARVGWLRAMNAAVARVAEGLRIEVPVLVARAASSGSDADDNVRAGLQDTVVDVEAIARLAPRLGPRVDTLVIDDGVHDLTLSQDGPRAVYLASMLAWIDSLAP